MPPRKRAQTPPATEPRKAPAKRAPRKTAIKEPVQAVVVADARQGNVIRRLFLAAAVAVLAVIATLGVVGQQQNGRRLDHALALLNGANVQRGELTKSVNELTNEAAEARIQQAKSAKLSIETFNDLRTTIRKQNAELQKAGLPPIQVKIPTLGGGGAGSGSGSPSSPRPAPSRSASPSPAPSGSTPPKG